MPLTDTKIRSLRATGKIQKISDGGGLYVFFVKQKIDHKLHFTPKHGSWVNVAEIGLSVLKSQCLNELVDSLEKMRSKVSAWVDATFTCTKKKLIGSSLRRMPRSN